MNNLSSKILLLIFSYHIIITKEYNVFAIDISERVSKPCWNSQQQLYGIGNRMTSRRKCFSCWLCVTGNCTLVLRTRWLCSTNSGCVRTMVDLVTTRLHILVRNNRAFLLTDVRLVVAWHLRAHRMLVDECVVTEYVQGWVESYVVSEDVRDVSGRLRGHWGHLELYV